MNAYLITTPENPEYSGKTFGIPFSGGKAVLAAETLDPHLKYRLEDVLQGLKDLPGYSIRPLSDRAALAVEAALAADALEFHEAQEAKLTEQVEPQDGEKDSGAAAKKDK